jgi:hypothetical protein
MYLTDIIRRVEFEYGQHIRSRLFLIGIALSTIRHENCLLPPSTAAQMSTDEVPDYVANGQRGLPESIAVPTHHTRARLLVTHITKSRQATTFRSVCHLHLRLAQGPDWITQGDVHSDWTTENPLPFRLKIPCGANATHRHQLRLSDREAVVATGV